MHTSPHTNRDLFSAFRSATFTYVTRSRPRLQRSFAPPHPSSDFESAAVSVDAPPVLTRGIGISDNVRHLSVCFATLSVYVAPTWGPKHQTAQLIPYALLRGFLVLHPFYSRHWLILLHL